MSWENLDLNAIAADEGQPAPPPEGMYTFRILKAGYSQFVPGRLDFDFVVDEGQYKGRRVFPTLPEATSPEHWAAKAAAKLLKTLGTAQDAANGETPIAAIQRAVSGQPRVSAQLSHDNYTDKDGKAVTKANIKMFTVSAVA